LTFVDEMEFDAFWHRFGAKGMRMAVLDAPKCTAVKAVNGIHLADWLVHVKYAERPRSYPEALAEDVLSRFGPAPPSACDYYQPAPSDDRVREIVGNLRASVAKKRAAARHYLAAEPWDLFIAGFKEGHCTGHSLWNFANESHPEFDEARSERLGWPVEQIFRDLDAAIGDLVAAAEPEVLDRQPACSRCSTALMPRCRNGPRASWTAR
jgi:predicted AlkP superfamily phosphohydrolase/phosphomutase